MFYFNSAVIKLMNYNNYYNKTLWSTLYTEYKYDQPLGGDRNMQGFHKTLQHLFSKKIKQKHQIYFEIYKMILCQSFLFFRLHNHRSVSPKLSKGQDYGMIIYSYIFIAWFTYKNICIYTCIHTRLYLAASTHAYIAFFF